MAKKRGIKAGTLIGKKKSVHPSDVYRKKLRKKELKRVLNYKRTIIY